MKTRVAASTLVLAACLCGVPDVVAWDPIPAEVFAMKEDPAAGVMGAVVLEERIIFKERYIEFQYRVRILSEAGKDAAEFVAFPKEAYAIDGRTVQPDGTIVKFSERKDLESIKVKGRGDSARASRLVPPGVTGNCVVEVKWRESTENSFGPLPTRYGYFHQWELGNRYKTLQSVVDLPNVFSWAYLFSGPDNLSPTRKDNVYTIQNIPGEEDLPFGLAALRLRPRFSVFWQPEEYMGIANRGGEAYWKGIGKIYKEWLGRPSKGEAYAALRRELTKELPGDDDQARALNLMVRLDARVVNTDYLTWQEKAKETEKEASKEQKVTDLEAAARTGRTSGYGMFFLYFNLLKDLGMKPTLAFVAPRSRRIFNPGMLTPFQLDDQLVGIRHASRETTWVDPSARFASPGIVWPEYQGTTGLELDPDTWEMKPVRLPVQGASYNVRQFLYEVAAGEEEDQFKVVARFQGYPEYAERRAYLALEPKEQARTLKEELEENLGTGAALETTEVFNAQDSANNVYWAASGRTEVESSRRRVIRPFPGLPAPLAIPSALPEKRSMMIVLPYARTHTAQSKVTLPEGYRFSPVEKFVRTNGVGSVAWWASESEPGSVLVTYKVEIANALLPAEAYGQLKDFLAWMKEAQGFMVTSERGRGGAQ